VNARQCERQRMVAESLVMRAADVEPGGVGRWRLSLRGDAAAAVAVDARLDDDWLHLSASLQFGMLEPPGELLRRNAELRGGAKFARIGTTGTPEVQLRTEVPLDDEQLLVHQRIAEACAGFESALAVGGSGSGCLPASARAGEPPDLQTLLAESGWPAGQRADRSLSVNLGVPDAFFQAEIETRAGATSFAVGLAMIEDAASVCREALALLLFRAAAVVRMARPVLASDGGAPRFEVVLAGAPSAAEVGHALSALAVACRLFGREVEVVQRSEAIAARSCAAHLGGAARVHGIS
jgi:hypothetical protein